MPSLNWGDIVSITKAAAKQELLDQLEAVGFSATSWQAFSIPLTTVEAVAEVRARLSDVAVYLKTAFLNVLATGEALTQFSRSHYANERNLATPAQRLITLACPATSGPYVINTQALILSAPQGQTFRNIEGNAVVYPATLAAGGTLQMLFQAEVAGSKANVGPGMVTKLVTTLAGVTVSSDIPTLAGKDSEADSTLQTRNETKWALLTQFELIDDAVIQIALSASPLITLVAVDSTNPRGPGTFDVYCAGPSGPSNSPELTLVQSALDKRVMGPPGTARTRAANSAALLILGTVYFDPTHDAASVSAAVDAAIDAYLQTVPLGGFDFSPGPSHVVRLSDLQTVIANAQVNGNPAFKTSVLTSPIGDYAVGAWGKVYRDPSSLLNYVPIAT